MGLNVISELTGYDVAPLFTGYCTQYLLERNQ